ncbi:hypothetical protein B9Z55_011850 [Caenorhabditis nigoni]|uniref:F-box domain-containing protein n=1 Tax=Caenorhabditis nigoni TaxID=1611254 RepID=A0A2G5UM02_9PELO|nr:hypothetical protein B9Z55_011850 [Caenorhabditis nigoni]
MAPKMKKFKKSSKNPIYDTNWCDMPPEIKVKCIGKMEFKERLLLRCTAKAERSLVDSQKIEFQNGEFWADDEDIVFKLNRGKNSNFLKSPKNINVAVGFLKYIKKVGVFENLKLCFGDLFTDNEQFNTDDGLFAAKKVEIEQCEMDNVVPSILWEIEDGVESIKINVDRKVFRQFDELLEISNMWIETNAKVGFTFQASIYKEGSFAAFLEHFTDSIVSKDERRVRIRTKNPDIHILLERGLDEIVETDDIPQFSRLRVIPAEMKKSEYDNNCKEWISIMDPDVYESESESEEEWPEYFGISFDEDEDGDDFDPVDYYTL